MHDFHNVSSQSIERSRQSWRRSAEPYVCGPCLLVTILGRHGLDDPPKMLPNLASKGDPEAGGIEQVVGLASRSGIAEIAIAERHVPAQPLPQLG